MLESMTGFGRDEVQVGAFRISWQLKTVNHRYLEFKFRLPDAFSFLEPAMREKVRAAFTRGSLECALRVDKESGAEPSLVLHQGLLAALLAAEKQLRRRTRGRKKLTLDRLLSWPGLVSERAVEEVAGLHEAIGGCFDRAVVSLLDSRRGEGARLAEEIRSQLAQLERQAEEVEGRLPGVRQDAERRIREQVEALTAMPVDAQRLAQELAFLWGRLDIAEELARLRSHITLFRQELSSREPVGKRLDFLCQELNREANTLCSKSQDADLTRLGVGMKVVVEKIREQVQNLQ